MLIFAERTEEEEEMMDDFSLGGEDFEEVLDQIATINRYLGGNSITLSALKKIFLDKDNNQSIFRMIDAGCGNGDMCRAVVKLARKQNIQVEIIGIDANQAALEYAARLSVDYPEISYKFMDIFSSEFESLEYDILITTLTLHHFKDDVIDGWLHKVAASATIGIVINDLQRSKIAYFLFRLLALVTPMNKMNLHDGLISIKRGFSKSDINTFNKSLKDKYRNLSCSFQWKWAFRYLWIIKKI